MTQASGDTADAPTLPLRAWIDRSGMGIVYAVDIGDVRVWTHAFAMDGPLDPEAESLFRVLNPQEYDGAEGGDQG